MKRVVVRILSVCLLLAVALAAVITVIVETGLAEKWARPYVVHRIEASTGARVQLGAFHFHLRGLRLELDDLTLHGRETAGLPPFVHIDQVRVGVHIISLFERKASLSDLEVIRPSVFVRIGENGESNIPSPQHRGPSKPWREQLFNLEIANLKVSDGFILFNNARIPLDAEGKDFRFQMNYEAQQLGGAYLGELGWKQVEIAARRFIPFRMDVSTRFTLTRSAFSLNDFHLKLPDTQLDAYGELPGFKPVAANFHCRGDISLPDLRLILRKPSMPDGHVQFTANGSYRDSQLRMSGHYLAQGIVLKFHWFHAGGIQSWSDFEVADNHLTLPAFEARALGGQAKGHLDMDFHGLNFRTTAQFNGARLAQVLAAVDNEEMPVNTLHWDGAADTDAVLTWTRDFKQLTTRGVSVWSPTGVAPGKLPITAHINFDYAMTRDSVIISPSTIDTPVSTVLFAGAIAKRKSDLAVNFHTGRIADWQDFINDLRGNPPNPEAITGVADWNGKLTGPITGPAFAGSFHAVQARYGKLYWADITGRMSYSPKEFELIHAAVERGSSSAILDLTLGLDGHWNFHKEGTWSLSAHLVRDSTDDLQSMFGVSYPAHAIVTADFQGSGTRGDPVLDGTFDLTQMVAYDVRIDHAKGELHLRHDQIRIIDAEVDRDTGKVTGSLDYRLSTKEVNFQMVGSAIPLNNFRYLQLKALPVSGQLDFKLSGEGPIAAPKGHGTFQLTNLQFGAEIPDSFAGQIDSDGQFANLVISSTKSVESLKANVRLGLSGGYPLTGSMSLYQVDLDPFIVAAFHLQGLTGHSNGDGQFTISGNLLQPDTIIFDAYLSRLSFDYQYVKLHNEGPIRLIYNESEVRIEQASLSGPDTNFQFSGDARLTGTKALNLNISGAINLRLAAALFPDLEARGVTQLNASITGTLTNPQIVGQARVENASAHYGDFPAGLSALNGNIVFDRNRLIFENMTAQAGGGDLKISGSVGYGESPMHYEVDATARSVRIRYPEGMSWLLDGGVQFSGTTRAALLSGNVTVQRVVFGQGVDLTSMLVVAQNSSSLTGPAITSAYLRNLQFDVGATAGAGMRIDWAGARFTAEGSVRVRGTWEHPIVLGNVHLLSGEMAFHGNSYRLTRGDVNFTNPFRFDPVLNIEAATDINPYEITLDFTGPASRMQLSYRSDPPLPGTDIISLLALGSPGEQTAFMNASSSQTQNFGATALLSEAISSQLGGPIEKLFGVTNFRVDPFLASSLATSGVEQSTAARVTIQKQVTRDLSVTYSTNANSNQQQVIEVDYAVSRNISIVALRDINGIFGINVKFTSHFK
ncbi:MAG TPA: translocation/assembly module TamB domain-containing protein [Candidatus Acidoferrales bacterium]|nr:translocation/assembly module TamB domain-containing protein [Candidatus Acidoferrales bacterium]